MGPGRAAGAQIKFGDRPAREGWGGRPQPPPAATTFQCGAGRGVGRGQTRAGAGADARSHSVKRVLSIVSTSIDSIVSIEGFNVVDGVDAIDIFDRDAGSNKFSMMAGSNKFSMMAGSNKFSMMAGSNKFSMMAAFKFLFRPRGSSGSAYHPVGQTAGARPLKEGTHAIGQGQRNTTISWG